MIQGMLSGFFNPDLKANQVDALKSLSDFTSEIYLQSLTIEQ
jgi:hypothetical protein